LAHGNKYTQTKLPMAPWQQSARDNMQIILGQLPQIMKYRQDASRGMPATIEKFENAACM
jgi:hypothetical protein